MWHLTSYAPCPSVRKCNLRLVSSQVLTVQCQGTAGGNGHESKSSTPKQETRRGIAGGVLRGGFSRHEVRHAGDVHPHARSGWDPGLLPRGWRTRWDGGALAARLSGILVHVPR